MSVSFRGLALIDRGILGNGQTFENTLLDSHGSIDVILSLVVGLYTPS